MSNLPTTNNYKEPLSVPSEVRTQQSDIPDLSNPYAYPSNHYSTINSNAAHAAATPDNHTTSMNSNATFDGSSTIGSDPELIKMKSSIWKRAAQLQSTIGSLAGLNDWQTAGKRAEEEADREYRQADSRLAQGEASRVHGEYDRLMGYVHSAIGHIAGDNEMQTKGNRRAEQGVSEIQRSVKH